MPQGTPLYIPFTAASSPDRARAETHNLAWARRYGLLGTEEAESRYRSWRLADLAARTNPHALGADLDVVFDVLGFMFLFDDQFDGRLGREHGRTQALCERLAALTWPAGRPRPRSGVPVVDAWMNLWPRCAEGMSAVWQQRTALHFREYFQAHVREASNRARRRPPGVEEYLSLRRNTVAMRPLQDLIERVGHFEVPQHAYESRQLREMREITTLVIALNNDISSLEKEASRGDSHNLVLVLQREQGSTESEAIDLISTMVRTHMERFLALEQEVPEVSTALGLDSGQQAAVQRLVQGMRAWMRGCYDWEARTARYATDSLLPADGPGHLEDLVSPRTEPR